MEPGRRLLVLLAVMAVAQAAQAGVQRLDATAAYKLWKDQGWKYVDVRTPAEFAAGHVPGALNIPWVSRSASGQQTLNPNFLAQVRAAFPSRSAKFIVGCQTGHRSAKAAQVLAATGGYSGFVENKDGYAGWRAAGLPTTAAARFLWCFGKMGIPMAEGGGLLSAGKIDLSHQEMTRLLDKLEELWDGYTTDENGPNGCEWLPVQQISNLICEELGYEDEPEFEDALKGSFADFLDRLPHATKKEQDGRLYFQLRPDPPQSAWRSVKMTARIGSTADLWRVCLKSRVARIEIPELEFEISADGKRHTDTIYNHIASAVYNLGNYVQQPGTGLSEDHKNKIMDTVIALNILLDVPKPFTWVLHDPSGQSEFKPMDGIEVEWGPPPAAQQEQQEQGQQEQQERPAGEQQQ